MTAGGGVWHRGMHGAVAGVLLWALVAPSVLADHIPGATYTGQTSSGGSMTVTLTPDVGGVAGFAVKDIHSQNCPNVTLSIEQNNVQPAGLAPIQEPAGHKRDVARQQHHHQHLKYLGWDRVVQDGGDADRVKERRGGGSVNEDIV